MYFLRPAQKGSLIAPWKQEFNLLIANSVMHLLSRYQSMLNEFIRSLVVYCGELDFSNIWILLKVC